MNDILDTDIVEQEYVLASKGKRFTNYIIDTIVNYFFSAVSGGILGIVLVLIGQEEVFLSDDESSLNLLSIAIALISSICYYTLSEYYLNGKTIGKYLTKTRAVTVDNYRMTLSTAFIRSACRVIPFEAFSFLGDSPLGWHDLWSKTKVVLDE